MADGPWTKYARQQPQTTAPPASRDAQIEREAGTFLSRSAGLAQGAILNPIEEVGRFIEHVSGTKIPPDVIRDKLKSFRSYARSSRAGRIAEVAGEVGGAAIPFLGAAGKAARVPGLVSGAVRGGLSAGLQPVENSKDYMSDKAAQVGLGALTGGMMASPLARTVASWLATRGLIHGGAAALLPHQYWMHWPLHHLANSVQGRIPPVVGRVIGSPSVVGGTTAAIGAGLGRDTEEDGPQAPPPPAAPPSADYGGSVNRSGKGNRMLPPINVDPEDQ